MILPDSGERYVSLPWFAPPSPASSLTVGLDAMGVSAIVAEIRRAVAAAQSRDPAAAGVEHR